MACVVAGTQKVYVCASLVIALILLIAACFSKRVRIVLLPALLTFVLFTFWYGYRDLRPQNLPTGKMTLTGRVCDEPIEQSDQHRTVITLSDCFADSEAISGKVRLYLYSPDAAYETGDELRIKEAKLSIASSVTNPNGFDFNAYLWRNGVSLVASADGEDVKLTEKHASLKRGLMRLRRSLAGVCDRVFKDSSDVTRAVLLGDRSNLSDNVYDDFSSSGISHLIALSGLHVSALALLFEFLFKRLRVLRFIRNLLTVALLCLYTVMTGSSSSTVRAVLMYALLCLARQAGYFPDTLTRLCQACLIQLAINPLLIRDNAFVLSYASVAAILCFSDVYIFQKDESHKALKSLLLSARASFSVQVVSFPLLSAMFYQVPLLSVPVNILCVPLAMLALYGGIVVLLTGTVYAPLAALLAYPIRLIWHFIKAVSAYVASLPFANVLSSAWPLWLCVLFVSAVLFGSVYMSGSKHRRVLSFLLAFVMIVVSLLPVQPIDHLRVTFLSVGEADSAVFDAQGHSFVVDCGKDNGVTADYLTSVRANVSGIFISHADADHYGGTKDILARYPNAAVYLPDCWDEMSVPDELYKLLKGKNVKYVAAGDRIKLSKDVYADVLWPEGPAALKDDNDGSLVLNVVYKETSVLMMADLSDKLDKNIAVDADIIKIAHHGSKNATSSELLETVTPEVAVISVGSNAYGHPTQEVLERLSSVGSSIYRTDELGAVTIDIYPNGEYTAQGFLQAEE
ncbi:MAG: DNA internalization-related competence protein ComEC/Rec2 [Clostridia bacterium]|nr:DNA internalization-related competence protein ComEC/Rec2 [Clostridia bacterium]